MILKVVTLIVDHGDGGGSMRLYRDHNHLKEELKDQYGNDKAERVYQELLDDYDPYKNGYLGEDAIEFEIVDGVPVLTKEVFLNYGQ